jgi:CheY-like chemotaxis protein
MPLCREKGIHFDIDAEPVDDVLPIVDSLRVNQVIFNLLSNAVKFTPEGGTVTFRMREHITEDGKLAMEGTVRDNGIGMSREFQKVLFEPFTQEVRNDRSGVQGTGLGLAIVKKLLDLMGCTIRVESEIGKGTAFIFGGKFDFIPAHADNTNEKASEVRESVEDLKNRHVLLCEDHPLNQEIAADILKDKGMIVQLAEDGKQGTEAFRNSPTGFYDAILMDIHMPVMDGFEAARVIRSMKRADASSVPIIAMTADAFTEDVEKCLAAGMNAHLAKPIDPEKMVQVLKENIRE